jgi:hypothetical protein
MVLTHAPCAGRCRYIATDETAKQGLSKPRDRGGKIDFDPAAPGTHGDHT